MKKYYELLPSDIEKILTEHFNRLGEKVRVCKFNVSEDRDVHDRYISDTFSGATVLVEEINKENNGSQSTKCKRCTASGETGCSSS